MKQIILVAHGKLAIEMLNSAQMIFGEMPDFTPIEFTTTDGLDVLREKIQHEIKEEIQEVLIFTDLFCGTPYNASCAIAMTQKEREIEVLSGMSLPLILEIAGISNKVSVRELAEQTKINAQVIVQSFDQSVTEEEEEEL